MPFKWTINHSKQTGRSCPVRPISIEDRKMKILQIVLLSALLAASPFSLADKSSASSSAAGVPELDAGAAGVSFGLILVVTALMRERRKRS
jgi:hypothetical protein